MVCAHPCGQASCRRRRKAHVLALWCSARRCHWRLQSRGTHQSRSYRRWHDPIFWGAASWILRPRGRQTVGMMIWNLPAFWPLPNASFLEEWHLECPCGALTLPARPLSSQSPRAPTLASSRPLQHQLSVSRGRHPSTLTASSAIIVAKESICAALCADTEAAVAATLLTATKSTQRQTLPG